jgi:Flp pilus assembly protein TadG
MRKLRGENGNELVEFAIVIPVLMMALTGVAGFSMAFYAFQLLGNATADAVRYVGADQGMIGDPCATAVTKVENALPGWNTSNFTFQMTITDKTGTGNTYPGAGSYSSGASFSCAAGATEEAPGEAVTLTVKYKYPWLPILNFVPPVNLTATQSSAAD